MTRTDVDPNAWHPDRVHAGRPGPISRVPRPSGPIPTPVAFYPDVVRPRRKRANLNLRRRRRGLHDDLLRRGGLHRRGRGGNYNLRLRLGLILRLRNAREILRGGGLSGLNRLSRLHLDLLWRRGWRRDDDLRRRRGLPINDHPFGPPGSTSAKAANHSDRDQKSQNALLHGD